MSQGIQPYTKPTMEGVHRQFEHWRKTRLRRSAVPEYLWDAAVTLAKQYPLCRISRTLGLDYRKLKKRHERRTPEKSARAGQDCSFIELPGSAMLLSGVEWSVEAEDLEGAKIKMTYRGPEAMELLEVARILWGKTR
jgi:hypothetical protein